MRVNVYSQELTSEVVEIEKVSNTGRTYKAAQLILHSSKMLHHPPDDDDRSAVTFWLPTSQARREEMAVAFEKIAGIFRGTHQGKAGSSHDEASAALQAMDPVDLDILFYGRCYCKIEMATFRDRGTRCAHCGRVIT